MYTNEYSFIWKIEHFTFCSQTTGDCLYSPTFTFRSLTEQECDLKIRLYPRGKLKLYDTFVSCFIDMRGCDNFPAFNLETKVVGPSGKLLKKVKWRNYESINKEKEWKSLKFLSIAYIAEDAQDSTEDSLTLYCKLYGKNSSADVFDEHITHTKIGVDRQLFKLYARYSDGRLEFQRNTDYFKNKYLRFFIASEGNKLNIPMWRRGNLLSPFVVSFKITLLDINNYETYSEKYNYYFQDKKYTFVIPLAMFVNELKKNLGAYQRRTLNSWIHFHAELSYSSGTETHFLPNKETFQTKTSALNEDLRTLFYSKKFSDVKLRVKDEVMEAHKNVLAARSPVFAVMFDHGMTEAQMGVVNIVDIDAPILRLFLQFLYTDTVDEMDYDVATHLLIAADKYQVSSLKEKCCIFLKTEISVKNVCDILTLANAVNHEYLKSACVDFITNIPADVLSSPEWKSRAANNEEWAAATSRLNSHAPSSKNMCRTN